MASSSTDQVLIVGAGPIGLALACQCLRLGLRVRIIDKQPGPSTTSKAMALQFRASEVLACMGLADRFLARSTGAFSVNLYSGPRKLLKLDGRRFQSHSGREAFSPRLMLIPQSETEAILGEAVLECGGKVLWGTELLDFRQDDDKVVSRLRMADGQEQFVESQWLVSCEGAHSLVRKQAKISFAGKTYPLAFFMADLELDWPLDHAATHLWIHPEGSFAALPLPGRDKWRLFVEVTQQLDQMPGNVTLDLIRELMARRVGSVAAIRGVTWISEFRVSCRMVDRYRAGRVLLAGDAAHIHSPTGGQGIATGIQDATNLAWKLARVLRGAPESLLDTYQEERLPKAREVLKKTDGAMTILFAPNARKRFLRDFVVLPVLRSPWVQKKMFGKFAQLHVNYRGSSLSRHEDRRNWFTRTRIKAGDRAPDVAFRDASSGRIVTLFDLLRPLRPVALIGTGSTVDMPRARRLADSLHRSGVDAYLLMDPRIAEVETSREQACDRARAAQTDALGHASVKVTSHKRPPQAKLPCLRDAHGDFRRLYGMAGDFLCLIRPDDHVGLFQRPINEASLDDYLGMLGTALHSERPDSPPGWSAADSQRGTEREHVRTS